MKSCQRLKIDPLQLYGTNVVKCGEVREAQPGAEVPGSSAPRTGHRGPQDHRRHGRADGGGAQRRPGAAGAARRRSRPARSSSSRPAPRCSSPRTSTPRWTSSVSRRRSGTPSAAWASGTTPSRRTDRAAPGARHRGGRAAARVRLPGPAPAAAAAARRHPRFARSCSWCCMALLVWGLLPLRALGRRLLLPGAAALAVGLLATRLGAVPVADVAKIVAATAVGLWVSGELEQVSWVVVRGRGFHRRRHRERVRRAHQGAAGAGPGGGGLLHRGHDLVGLHAAPGLQRPGRERPDLLCPVPGRRGAFRPAPARLAGVPSRPRSS